MCQNKHDIVFSQPSSIVERPPLATKASSAGVFVEQRRNGFS